MNFEDIPVFGPELADALDALRERDERAAAELRARGWTCTAPVSEIIEGVMALTDEWQITGAG